MYEAKVTLEGITKKVKWDKGKLSGDQIVLDVIEIELAGRNRIERFAEGPVWTGSEMRSGNAIYFLLLEVFDDVEIVDGELPSLPSIPKGALG